MENKKYKLTDETIEVKGKTLYRIEALKDFGEIKKGDKGGFIESENNLAHEGDAWVSDDACVYDNARVSGNAHIYGEAWVYGSACVSDNARVFGKCQVYGGAFVYDGACVYGYTHVCGFARVFDNARVHGNACVYGDALVFDNARVYGNAHLFANVRLYGYTCVCGDAEISNKSDYIVFKNWWSSGRYFTWTRSNNMWSVGCFYGTGEELIKKAYKDSELSGRQYERLVKYVEETLKDGE